MPVTKRRQHPPVPVREAPGIRIWRDEHLGIMNQRDRGGARHWPKIAKIQKQIRFRKKRKIKLFPQLPSKNAATFNLERQFCPSDICRCNDPRLFLEQFGKLLTTTSQLMNKLVGDAVHARRTGSEILTVDDQPPKAHWSSFEAI